MLLHVAIGELNRGKRPIGVKIGDVLSHVTVKLDNWYWKIKKKIVHLFSATSNFLYLFVAICEFTVALYGPEMTKLGQNVFWPRPRPRPSTSHLS